MKLEGQFQIAEPCHENWENMTPESKGRFCDACQKCVVDFSNMSKLEIKQVYDKEEGDVCGRMPISQLQEVRRPAIRGKLNRVSNRLRSIQKFALALLFVFGLQGTIQLTAQNHHPVKMGKIAYVAPTASVGGEVSWDSGAKAIAQKVEIFQGKELVQTVKTNSSGSFNFSDLDPGTYTIRITPQHGVASTQEVKLKARERKHVSIELNDLMILGDTIYIPDEPIEQDVLENPNSFQIIEEEDGAIVEPVIVDVNVVEVPVVGLKPIETPLVIDDIDIESECKCIHETPIIHPLIIDMPATQAEPAELPSNSDVAMKAPVLVDGFKIVVFPNPVSDQLNFKIEEHGNAPLEMKLMTIDGKVVYEKHWAEAPKFNHKIDMRNWTAGTYLLEIQSGKHSHRQKVLKF